jgi:hypothetical protein
VTNGWLRDGACSGVTWRVVCGVSCGRWWGNGRACCIFGRKQSGLCARVLGVCWRVPPSPTPYAGPITVCFTFLRLSFTPVFLPHRPTYPTAHSAPLCLPWADSRISSPSPVPSHCFTPLIFFSPLSLSRLSASPPRPPLAVH